MKNNHEITAHQPARPGLRLPTQAAPIDRAPGPAAPNASAGIEASQNLCDLLPSPANMICHLIGHGIGTE